MEKRFLFTGGAGFLGINLVRYLLSRGQRVTTLDLQPFAYPVLRERVREIRGDIRNAEDVRATLPEDIVNDTFNIGAREFGAPRSDFQAVLDGSRVREANRVAARHPDHLDPAPAGSRASFAVV